jgi:hypothetical protein
MWEKVVVLGMVSLLTLLEPIRAEEDAKLREVIARAIKAHGGSDNLTKFKAQVSKEQGKFHNLGQTIDFTSVTSLQLPDRLCSEVQFNAGGQKITVIQVINGNKGWFKFGDKTEEMNKDMLAEAREQMNAANISYLVCLNNKEYKLSPLGEVQIGDRPAIGVRVERKGYRDVNLFFDKDKGLLLKLETRSKDLMRGGQEYTSTIWYDDYKKVEGIMVPHKTKIEHDGKPYVEAKTIEVKISEKLDDSVFEKP